MMVMFLSKQISDPMNAARKDKDKRKIKECRITAKERESAVESKPTHVRV